MGLFILFSASSKAELPQSHFPVDDAMRIRVDFWKKVYTEIESHQAFIHDIEDLTLIYKVIDYKGKGRRARRRIARKEKRAIRSELRSIARKKKQNLTEKEQKLLELIKDPPIKKIRQMARQIRHQQGLRDRYLQGLERSYRYLGEIRKVFREEGIPVELSYLPHVESSFNHKAYSKVGAAGMWQFMRATARLYKMKVGYIIDERRDPFIAARAAARLLKDNYVRLGTWPLALTAYNHGPVSLERAVRKVASTNMSDIIERYQGRRFGFASKNFYATFVATAEISQNPEKHFKNIEKLGPIEKSEIVLDRAYTVNQLVRATGLTKNQIREYNYSLRPIAFRSSLYLPKGFRLKLPKVDDEKLKEYQVAFSKIRKPKKNFRTGGTHVVSRGESLYLISKIYRVGIHDLIAFNKIESPTRIYPGMKLKIPSSDDKKVIQTPEPEVIVAKKEVKPAETPPSLEKLEQKEETPPTISFWEKVKRSISSTFKKKEVAKVEVPEKQDPDKKPVGIESYRLDLVKRGKHYQLFVEPEETIGHYADWAGVGASQIRRLNGIYRGEAIILGQRLLIPVREGKVSDFSSKRMEHHLAIQEDFYENYKFEGMSSYIVKRGDTIGEILREQEIPFWLLRKYEKPPQKHLEVGQKIKIPVFREISSADSEK